MPNSTLHRTNFPQSASTRHRLPCDAPPDQLFFEFSGQSSCLVLERRATFQVAPFHLDALCRHVLNMFFCFVRASGFRGKLLPLFKGKIVASSFFTVSLITVEDGMGAKYCLNTTESKFQTFLANLFFLGKQSNKENKLNCKCANLEANPIEFLILNSLKSNEEAFTGCPNTVLDQRSVSWTQTPLSRRLAATWFIRSSLDSCLLCPGDCGGHISFDTGCEKLCFDSRLLRPGGPDLKPDRLQTLMTTKPPSIIDHWPLCQETAPIYPTQCHWLRLLKYHRPMSNVWGGRVHTWHINLRSTDWASGGTLIKLGDHVLSA